MNSWLGRNIYDYSHTVGKYMGGDWRGVLVTGMLVAYPSDKAAIVKIQSILNCEMNFNLLYNGE